MSDAFQVMLVGALRCRTELQRAAEVQRDLRQLVGTRDQHDAPDRVRVRHRRPALGDEQRDETAERMRDDGVDLAEVIAHGEHGARAVGKIGAPPRAQPVGGKVECDDTIARAPQRLHERRHEGGLARPPVYQHDGAAPLAVGLEDVSLYVARRSRQASATWRGADGNAPARSAHHDRASGAATAPACRRCGRRHRRPAPGAGCRVRLPPAGAGNAALKSASLGGVVSRRTRSADMRGSKFRGNRPRGPRQLRPTTDNSKA